MAGKVVTNDMEEEIDLREVLFEMLDNWKPIIASTAICAVIAALISLFLITPKYESTSELYVLSKSTSLTSLADIQMGTSLTNDYIVTVVDRPVLEIVINNLGLNEDYKELYDKITVNNPSNSRILKITVKDADAQRAKAIADETATVASAFIATKMDQDPPSIISYGYADGEKVSPSTSKNTLIGALIGFVLAAGVVFVEYMLNDTIKTTEDIEKKLGLNILGQLPLEEEEFDGETKKSPRKKGKKRKNTKDVFDKSKSSGKKVG